MCIQTNRIQIRTLLSSPFLQLGFDFVFTLPPSWPTHTINEWLLSLTVYLIKDIVIKVMRNYENG